MLDRELDRRGAAVFFVDEDFDFFFPPPSFGIGTFARAATMLSAHAHAHISLFWHIAFPRPYTSNSENAWTPRNTCVKAPFVFLSAVTATCDVAASARSFTISRVTLSKIAFAPFSMTHVRATRVMRSACSRSALFTSAIDGDDESVYKYIRVRIRERESVSSVVVVTGSRGGV